MLKNKARMASASEDVANARRPEPSSSNARLIKRKLSAVDGDGQESLDFTYIQDLLNGLTKVVENKNNIDFGLKIYN